MARIDDLLSHISDAKIRDQLRISISEIRKRRQFGLVFESHLPETVLLPRMKVRKGALVTSQAANSDDEWVVEKVNGMATSLRHPRTGEQRSAKTSELIVVKPFGDPIFPTLTPIKTVASGGDRPWNAVINGENYHALQLLLYLYEGKVDCLYLDPPYNTGAKDWTYNNRFVDANDSYRHSKWLSFMDKRLRLAKRLLKPDGVLVVTIDENEVHHLGMLLERLFPEARRQMVTICINPSGVSGGGLSRVEEYAFFCFLGGTVPVGAPDDMLSETADGDEYAVAWESLLRRGNVWYRKKRKNLCYPIILDPKSKRIIGVGEPFKGKDESKRPARLGGGLAAWPVRRDGKLGIWRVDGARLLKLAEKGYAYVTSRDDERGTWTVKYLMTGTIRAIENGVVTVTGRGASGEVILHSTSARQTTAKTIWHRGRHTAGGAGGTQLLAAFLGERDVFPFPKSVYAVRDSCRNSTALSYVR